MRYRHMIPALLLLALAGCAKLQASSPPAVPSPVKSSAKAAAHAAATNPVVTAAEHNLQVCINAHNNPAHPVKSIKAIEACVLADYPRAPGNGRRLVACIGRAWVLAPGDTTSLETKTGPACIARYK